MRTPNLEADLGPGKGQGLAGGRVAGLACGCALGFQVTLLGFAFLVRKARFLRNGGGGRADHPSTGM